MNFMCFLHEFGNTEMYRLLYISILAVQDQWSHKPGSFPAHFSPIKGSRTEYSCSRNLNRWLNEHSSCSLILAWYATICCQPAGWSEQREISYKLRDRDEKQSLTVTVTYYSERESTWCTDFQKELLWQKLQLHLLGGSYQWGIRVDYKETGGEGGGRQESARKEVCESWASV